MKSSCDRVLQNLDEGKTLCSFLARDEAEICPYCCAGSPQRSPRLYPSNAGRRASRYQLADSIVDTSDHGHDEVLRELIALSVLADAVEHGTLTQSAFPNRLERPLPHRSG
jgi:hypothetical protein